MATTLGGTPPTTSDQPGLRRELTLADAAAFSIGLIGPVGVMALLGVSAAGTLGRAAVYAFAFALVAVGLVAYGFVKLSRHITHTGSVYALVGVTLGPRAGFVAGWALFGAYLTIGTGSCIEIGLFFRQVLGDVGLYGGSEWVWISVGALVVATVLAFTEIKVITRSLLGVELLGTLIVTVLSVVVLVRLATGHGPHGLGLTRDVFVLPSGTSIGTIGTAAVIGFLAFAGFEGAAALGEETAEPKRDIPRAFKVAILLVGAFYLLTIVAQSLGYGTGSAGVTAFSGSESPYGDLARAYVGSWLGTLLDLMASLSLFAILLGTTAAAARVLFALARDAGGRRGLARVAGDGAPVVAIAVAMLAVLGGVVGLRLTGAAVLDATFWALTLGTLPLLVAYVLASVGAIRFLFLRRDRRAPLWQVVLPVLGVLLVGYSIEENVVGLEPPYSWFGWITLAWSVLGLVVVLAVPGLAGRVRANLARSGAAETEEVGR